MPGVFLPLAILRIVGGLGLVVGVDTVLGQTDLTLLTWFAVFALLVGVGLVALDSKAVADVTSPVANPAEQTPVFAARDESSLGIDPSPLTLQTFWRAHHSSNTRGDSGKKLPDPARAFLDDDADLSTGGWEAKSLWWDDFDAFFAALRKGEPQ